MLSLMCLLPCVSRAAEPLRVVAMNQVMDEFARRIGGGEVSVVCLMPAGADLHNFSPAPSDVRKLASAGLVLATGFELEPWLGKLVRNSGTKAVVLEASSVVRDPVSSVAEHQSEEACAKAGQCAHEHKNDHDHGHAHGEHDPHWWHSLRAAGDVARGIHAKLCELRPGAKAAFDTGLASLEAELAGLSRWADTELARLPVARRQLVTSHDAFGYLARDHSFTIHPLNGVNPDAEADARSLARLIDFVSKNRIRAIFPDNTENPRVLAAMTKETGARMGGVLYADGPGVAGGPAADYASMYRHNLSTIISGLAE